METREWKRKRKRERERERERERKREKEKLTCYLPSPLPSSSKVKGTTDYNYTNFGAPQRISASTSTLDLLLPGKANLYPVPGGARMTQYLKMLKAMKR